MIFFFLLKKKTLTTRRSVCDEASLPKGTTTIELTIFHCFLFGLIT